jgi:UDP-glucuronate 4-epimerase
LKVNSRKKILVTGCAGFIGMHLCMSLAKDGFKIFGIDSMNDYYDKSLKLNRLMLLNGFDNFLFFKIDLTNFKDLKTLFKKYKPSMVVNLAAQAGVRYSLMNPNSYIQSNIVGFMNILECCRNYEVDGLIYASSSSVYGGNKNIPFSEKDQINNPISIYAATKISNELMAKSYNNLFGIKSTGLRFFTVFGDWGRPDMAYYIFTKKIWNNESVEVFNYGEMSRDFTHISDIVNGIKSAILKNYNCEIFNLGNSKTENILDMVKIIERKLDKKAKINLMPMQAGDVIKTNANISKAKKMLQFKPLTDFKFGLESFVDWFLKYYVA